MLFAPHCASAGVFCSCAATSPPTAFASLVCTGSQPVVEKPGCDSPAPWSVTFALLVTCQFGARSVVSADATAGATNAQPTASSAPAVLCQPMPSPSPQFGQARFRSAGLVFQQLGPQSRHSLGFLAINPGGKVPRFGGSRKSQGHVPIAAPPRSPG